MFALGIVIPVYSADEVDFLVQGDAYSTLRRGLEELVRDIHEKLEGGEYKVDFKWDVERFVIRIRDGLDVLQKVPLSWRGNDVVWRELIVSLSRELDSRLSFKGVLIKFSDATHV
jgi:hypothetical protein